MKIVIRTDASIEIGTGHVMRCLTLANQLERRGAEVTFICRSFEGNSISYLQNQGMSVKALTSIGRNKADRQWIKENWELDAQETVAIIKEMDSEVDLIIVDHYGLDSRWENTFRHLAKSIMVIDDLANRSHDCDLLLDQNYYLNMRKRYKGLVPDHCVQMLGPDYVLLRDEFLQEVNESRERTGEINNILVFFGGTDPTGETIKALKAINELNISEIKINVVVGASNPERDEIKEKCCKMSNVNYYCQVDNMAELMNEADLAIGAGGATTWERLSLRLPSLIVIVAENQLNVTNDIAKIGAIIGLGMHNEVTVKHLKQAILRLIENPDKVKMMANTCLVKPDKIKERLVLINILDALK